MSLEKLYHFSWSITNNLNNNHVLIWIAIEKNKTKCPIPARLLLHIFWNTLPHRNLTKAYRKSVELKETEEMTYNGTPVHFLQNLLWLYHSWESGTRNANPAPWRACECSDSQAHPQSPPSVRRSGVGLNYLHFPQASQGSWCYPSLHHSFRNSALVIPSVLTSWPEGKSSWRSQ